VRSSYRNTAIDATDVPLRSIVGLDLHCFELDRAWEAANVSSSNDSRAESLSPSREIQILHNNALSVATYSLQASYSFEKSKVAKTDGFVENRGKQDILHQAGVAR